MTSRKWRLPFLFLFVCLLSAPGRGVGAVPEVDDQVLVLFMSGAALPVKIDRFLKPPPVVAKIPSGGVNQLAVQDTKGKEKSPAPAHLGPGRFSFVRHPDAATPKLLEAACKGTHIETTKWKNLVLKRGVIQKFSVERIGSVAIETIEIAYESVDVSP